MLFVPVMWPLPELANADGDPALAEARRKLVGLAAVAQERGATLILQAPPPQFARSAMLCTAEWFRTSFDGCTVDKSDFEARRGRVMRVLEGIRHDLSNVEIWDPIDELCFDGTCPTLHAGKPLFRDTNHLANYGSTYLGPAFVKFLQANAPRTARL
jgi:hypothetical protein